MGWILRYFCYCTFDFFGRQMQLILENKNVIIRSFYICPGLRVTSAWVENEALVCSGHIIFFFTLPCYFSNQPFIFIFFDFVPNLLDNICFILSNLWKSKFILISSLIDFFTSLCYQFSPWSFGWHLFYLK